jgi:hypothetical protein
MKLCQPVPGQLGRKIVNDFWDLWNLPNCNGAIDGKHVKVQAPPNSRSKFSVTVFLLALVDASYKFTVFDMGSYGRNSHGGIFAHSKLREYLETYLGIPEDKKLPGTSCLAPHVIVGDEAFPLKTYLMRPYPGSQSKRGTETSIFNYQLSRARRVAENVFGILSQKFQICQRTLQSLPENTDNFIFATCILHNYLRGQGLGLSDVGSSANVRSNLTKIPNQGGIVHQSAFEVRDKFKQFFNSPSGSVL